MSDSDRVGELVRQWRGLFPDADGELLAVVKAVALASRALEDAGTRALAPYDLDAGQFDVLATLLRSGAPYRVRPSVLHSSLLISSGGITKRLDKLESRGLLERVSDPDDRRSRAVQLTADGREIALQAERSHIDLTTKTAGDALDTVTTAQRKVLTDALRELAEVHLRDADSA